MGTADIRRLMFFINQSPQAGPAARERLDQLLMALAFDQKVQVAFVGDGVWQLVSGQTSADGSSASFTDGYKSLLIYQVQAILVERESLQERGLDETDLLMQVEIASRDEIARRMRSQELLL